MNVNLGTRLPLPNRESCSTPRLHAFRSADYGSQHLDGFCRIDINQAHIVVPFASVKWGP